MPTSAHPMMPPARTRSTECPLEQLFSFITASFERTNSNAKHLCGAALPVGTGEFVDIKEVLAGDVCTDQDLKAHELVAPERETGIVTSWSFSLAERASSSPGEKSGRAQPEHAQACRLGGDHNVGQL